MDWNSRNPATQNHPDDLRRLDGIPGRHDAMFPQRISQMPRIVLVPATGWQVRTRGVECHGVALTLARVARMVNYTRVSVTVRGQAKYMAMSRERYACSRERELEAALAESKADLNE
ncbi:MAG: hypothetical protein KIT18_08805 [Burkholderiales bacterium]|nr:hypothetical protein [Burkholderiales bacterium]